MSKRDEIVKALESERFMRKCREDALAQQRVTIEALELALHEEEERIQYDRYVEEQMADVPDAHTGSTDIF